MNRPSRLLPLFLASLFLVALAGALASVAGPRAYVPRLLLLGAIVSLVAFLVRGRRELLFMLVRARRMAEPGPASTWLLAALVCFLATAVLDRNPLRLDATQRGLNRLSEASRVVLDAGSDPVELIGVFRETSPQRAYAQDLLTLYRVSSRRVRVEMLDPDRRPERARELRVRTVGTVLIKTSKAREEVGELTEASLTQAILRAENPRRFRIGFTTGHGERDLRDDGPEGLGRLAALLAEAGYDPFEIRLFDAEIPPDVAVLAVVGPARGFLPTEISRLREHLDRGGRLLLCLDPGVVIGLEDTFRARGVVLDSLEIVDESSATLDLGYGPRVVVVTGYANHPMVSPGLGYTVFSTPRQVSLAEEANWGLDATVLFQSGPRGRVVPVGAGDSPPSGPEAARPIAIAQEWEVPGSAAPAPGEPAPEKPYGRLCLIGDSDWLSRRFLELYDNRQLALRTFHWLSRREFLLRIPPLDTGGTPLRLSISGLRTLFYLLQVILPVGLVAIGIWVWNRRR